MQAKGRQRRANASRSQYTSAEAAAFGWQIHGGVEVTELSTNKQLSLSVLWILCGVTLLFVVYVFDLLLRVAFALHLPLQLIPP